MTIFQNIFMIIGLYTTIQITWQQIELKKQDKITTNKRDTLIAILLVGIIMYFCHV